MKKKQRIDIIVLVTVLLIAFPIFYLTYSNKKILTESEAISLIKATYPEFKNYPNDNSPLNQSKQNKTPRVGTLLLFRKGRGDLFLKQNAFLLRMIEA